MTHFLNQLFETIPKTQDEHFPNRKIKERKTTSALIFTWHEPQSANVRDDVQCVPRRIRSKFHISTDTWSAENRKKPMTRDRQPFSETFRKRSWQWTCRFLLSKRERPTAQGPTEENMRVAQSEEVGNDDDGISSLSSSSKWKAFVFYQWLNLVKCVNS